jgi:hypothetical protein
MHIKVCVRLGTARRNSAFTLTATYSEDSPVPPGFERCIGAFDIGPPPKLPPDGGNAKIKARARLHILLHHTRW